MNVKEITKKIKQRGISNKPIVEAQENLNCFQREAVTKVQKHLTTKNPGQAIER